MSKVICIAGESGSGKTTSMRNLDPKTTYYIDADGKGLSWKGWRKQYSKENKNYFACDDATIVRQYIKRIAEACPSVRVIVVDTINGLMVADEMRRSKEKGYDKWVDLAACVWDLVCECYTYRDAGYIDPLRIAAKQERVYPLSIPSGRPGRIHEDL